MSEKLQQLGADVARALDDRLMDAERRASLRASLVVPDEPLPERRILGRSGWVALAGTFAAVVVAWLTLPDEQAPLTFEVNEVRVEDASSTLVAADDVLPIEFSDESWVQLSPGSRAQVTELSVDGATVVLRAGEAEIFVRPRRTTNWRVRAGPFVVRVTGTRFKVGWDPGPQRFALAVSEGTVEVAGPRLPTRSVAAGDAVDVSLLSATPSGPIVAPPAKPAPAIEPSMRRRTRTTTPKGPRTSPSGRPSNVVVPTPAAPSIASPPRGEPSFDSRTPTPLPSPVPESPPEEESTPQPSPEPPAASEPRWRSLAEEGDYDAILEELTFAEVADAVETGTVADLTQLGAAARRAGDARAESIYLSLRRRFPGGEEAANAAFMIARMRFRQGAYSSAAGWFESYLSEAPEGRFAREAAGRSLESFHELGDVAGARRAATRYLTRYPDGPHADLAREVTK